MSALKSEITNRGAPPDSFLDELITWGKSEDLTVFDRNATPVDIYSLIKPKLGPWEATQGEPIPFIWHRRAALMEAMRVHAGFESSWNWREGVDTANATSIRNIEGQETGIFQVSHDSLNLDKSGELKKWLSGHLSTSVDSPKEFIAAMKSYHQFALAYYARLVRQNIRWAGPLLHGLIIKDLNPEAVVEFRNILNPKQ